MLLLLGLLGYGLRRYHYPIAPVVVGLILGPLAEQQLRRALAISQGDRSCWCTRQLGDPLPDRCRRAAAAGYSRACAAKAMSSEKLGSDEDFDTLSAVDPWGGGEFHPVNNEVV